VKGKASKDALHFLPRLPPIQTKPVWQLNPPSFVLNVQELRGRFTNQAIAASESMTCK